MASAQATAKGGSKVGKSGFRDLWLLTLTLIINAITVAVGLFQVRPTSSDGRLRGCFCHLRMCPY